MQFIHIQGCPRSKKNLSAEGTLCYRIKRADEKGIQGSEIFHDEKDSCKAGYGIQERLSGRIHWTIKTTKLNATLCAIVLC